jgi:hypothetical protein
LTQWEPNKAWMTLANLVRGGRSALDRFSMPDLGTAMGNAMSPLATGQQAPEEPTLPVGSMMVGRAPEGIERVAYGDPLTTGSGQTLALHPDVIDAASLAMSAGNVLRKGGTRAMQAAAKHVPLGPSAGGRVTGLTPQLGRIEVANEAATAPASTTRDSEALVNALRSTQELPEAPYIQTSSTTTGQLLPREGGMYDPAAVQRVLPRIQGRGGAYNERTQALLDSPAATNKVDELIARGMQINPDLAYWYGTYPLKQAFMNEVGDEGSWRRFMAHMASASQRNPVPQQNRMGSLLWNMDVRGQLADPNVRLLTNKLRATGDTAGPMVEFPETYGSLAQSAIFDRSKQLAQGAPVESVLDPRVKLGSFYENLMGNLDPVTVDVNALHGPIMMMQDPRWLVSKHVTKDPKTGKVVKEQFPRADVAAGRMSMKDALQRAEFWEAAPEGSEYGGLEQLWQRGARRAGVEPAEGQALGWYGSGDIAALKSPPEQYIQNIERLVRDRAAVTGQRPTQVLADMLRGKGHLAVGGLGAGAALGAGALSDESNAVR